MHDGSKVAFIRIGVTLALLNAAGTRPDEPSDC